MRETSQNQEEHIWKWSKLPMVSRGLRERSRGESLFMALKASGLPWIFGLEFNKAPCDFVGVRFPDSHHVWCP